MKAMSPRDIAFMLLPILVRQRPAFVLHEVVQMLVDDYVPRSLGAEELLLEGMGYLENIGYLAEAISTSYPVRMLMVTRAGRAATLDPQETGAHAARALPSTDLLHPTISLEALPEIDRGPDYFSRCNI
jgi:hypothetical protein